MKMVIRKGNHYSYHLPSFHTGIQKLKFRFKFDSSCLYPVVDSEDYAINKLYGFSIGLHHINSVRVGWRPDEQQACKKIALHFYIYNNRARISPYFATVEVDKWYDMEISVLPDRVQFTLRDDSGLFLSQSSAPFILPTFRFGYKLFFYAGGKKPARQIGR